MERIVSKGPAEYFYIKTTLEFKDENTSIDVLLFKAIIVKALLSLYGEVGAAITVDVLKFNDRLEAILRVHNSGFRKLWSALTLYSCYGDKQCVFRVHQVSSCLMALAVNTRQDAIL
uniref:Ribonuclease P protein subunit p14-like n=1 Tax=Saccoglossus kowalevskii TaxID=10224 RepID=A0ABM0ML15_SACKO|nr:PREDICTED: ribonuclease P protein subunit p14-like [Saccoglossus kowalevskii]